MHVTTIKMLTSHISSHSFQPRHSYHYECRYVVSTFSDFSSLYNANKLDELTSDSSLQKWNQAVYYVAQHDLFIQNCILI